MARHDWRCLNCNKFYPNLVISGAKIKNSVACFDDTPPYTCECGDNLFIITWESGEAPKGYVRQETIGDLWDKKQFDPHSEKAKKASAEAIKKTQRNTLKKGKKSD